jgi:DNA-3-methyladenine glycosylase II
MDKRVIKKGMEALVMIDEDVANAVEQVGYPAPRLRPVGFETMFAAILSQQISTDAARAIRERVIALMHDVSAKSLLKVDPEALRSAGMSYRKIEYARGLAEAIFEGRLDLQGMREQTDDEVISAITALRGFGLWSAEIYLMFALRRRDVFPAGDLALRSSLGILKDLEGKLTPKQARELVEHWSPWRSVGSLFLWHYYRGAPN